MSYVVSTGHDESALADHPEHTVVQTLDEAADVVEKFMKGYGFQTETGALVDPNSDRPEPFDNVEWHNDRPISFMHCDGQGPVVMTTKART